MLHSVPAGSHVTVDLEVDFFDHAAYEALNAWRSQHESTGGTVHIDENGTAALTDAAAGPPKRRTTRPLTRRGFAPWRSWQDIGSSGGTDIRGNDPHPLRPVLNGIDNYHRRHADLVGPHMQEVAYSQNPDTLFLTCADSRVIPSLITSSGPGDLFTVRNIGNVVGGHGTEPSVEAALAFALDELSVDSIVICGHSSCGAMTALLADPEDTSPDSTEDGRGAVDAWLDHARPSFQALRDGHPVATAAEQAGFSLVDQLGMVNIAVQLQNLEQHRRVGPAVAKGRVHLAGVFYDLATARVIRITADGIDHLDQADSRAKEHAIC